MIKMDNTAKNQQQMKTNLEGKLRLILKVYSHSQPNLNDNITLNFS